METYTSKFTNRFGEDWSFQHDYTTGLSTFTGVGVDWTVHPAIEGQAVELLLDEDEATWLKTSWQEATQHQTYKGLYCGLDTQFAQGSRNCWLTNDYCPLCLKQKLQFEYHHCIWSSAGGTDDYFNILKICNTCHAILTRGSNEDGIPKDFSAYYHQLMYFGMSFYPRNNPLRGRHKERKYLDLYPQKRKFIEDFDKLGKHEQDRVNQAVMNMARIRYQYFRDMSLGKWSWHEWYERKQQVWEEIENYESEL